MLAQQTDYKDLILELNDEIEQLRLESELSLSKKLSTVSVKERLFDVGGEGCRPSNRDFLFLLTDLTVILDQFSHIDSININDLVLNAIDWAILCVLEDKLQRISHLDFAINQSAIEQELNCVREWDPIKHTRWLAFEVEQQIQIRPAQYFIVKQLLAEPGSLLQLNMGMGKARVVVPMLVMEWLSKPWLTRLTVLPSILHEAVHFYQNTLVASVQLVKLYTMPFNRKIPLNEQIEKIISFEMRRCTASNGFLVVAPTHRNSLLLRQDDKGVLVRGLEMDFRDLIDESDAVLCHDFQLVYSIGEQIPLPNGPSRCHAVEAVLVSLANGRFKALSKPGLVLADPTNNGSFPRLRLLEAFFTDDHKHSLAANYVKIFFVILRTNFVG